MTKTAVSLTQNVKAAGCAAKLGPADLAQILHNLPTFHHPDVIVGTETSDDAGVFRLQNIPASDMQPVTMVECPRLLFPFAREIIASAVQHGGFPPLRIDPIDFFALFRQRLAQEQAGQQMPPPNVA